jgi:hypothetical protein
MSSSFRIRRRLSEVGGLGLAAPAADGDADGAGAFGGKLF